MNLNDLKLGEKGILKNIADDLEIKKRLQDIGFTKNSQIECVLTSAFKGPIAYRIKNTVIALRRDDAKKILVEVEA